MKRIMQQYLVFLFSFFFHSFLLSFIYVKRPMLCGLFLDAISFCLSLRGEERKQSLVLRPSYRDVLHYPPFPLPAHLTRNVLRYLPILARWVRELDVRSSHYKPNNVSIGWAHS